MASRKHARIVALGLLLFAGVVAGGYLLWRPGPAVPVVGVVRATEVRVAPGSAASSRPSRCRGARASVPATWLPNCPRSS
jgi:hypothetical protein